MTKYKFDSILIEITRKCNKSCVHCMRGNSENLTITKEIVDKIFEEIDDCRDIALTGGEPLLELDMIEYIVDKIISSNWNTTTIQLTTNGTITDKRIIDIFNKFCNSGKKRYAMLRISNDEYHLKDEYIKAYKYYSSICNHIYFYKPDEVISRKILVKYAYEELKALPYFLNYGRAVDYIVENQDLFTPKGKTPVKCPFHNNHRIKIDNNIVMCQMEIAANGLLWFSDEIDYKQFDKLSFGNILNNSICSVIQKNNDECLLLCHERDCIQMYENGKFVPKIDESGRICYQIYLLIIKRFVQLREMAHATYPDVPAQDIISLIQIPENTDLRKLIANIYNYNTEYRSPDSKKEMIKYIDDKTMEIFVNDYKSKSVNEMSVQPKGTLELTESPQCRSLFN